MADQQQDQSQQQQTTDRPQSHFDNTFYEQISGTGAASTIGWDVTHQVVQSYFDQVEASTRQSRRMADLWAQSLILQQTTNDIARAVVPAVSKQVIQYLQSRPDLLKQMTQS